MNFLKYVMGLAVAAALTACGGGGGSPGTISGSGAAKPLAVAAPSSVTVAPGAFVSYAVTGGQSPYSAVSDNTTITQVAITDDNYLTIGGILEGTSKVQVRDAKSSLVEISVIVSAGPVVALYTTAPGTVNMAPPTATTSSTQSFSVRGGTAPYVVFSDKTSVATATMTGSVLEIKAVAVGVATLKISDAVGASVSVVVNVASTGVPLSVSPTSASVFVDMAVEVFVIGGTPPYRVAGGIPAAMSTAFEIVDGKQTNKLIITPRLVGTFDVTILDSQDASTKFALTVISGQPTIRLSPNAVTVSEKDTQPIILTVFGASGTVTAFSSDLYKLTTSVSSDNKTITVTTGTSRCVIGDYQVTITVVDANRSSASAVITLKDNGSTVDAFGAIISNCPP